MFKLIPQGLDAPQPGQPDNTHNLKGPRAKRRSIEFDEMMKSHPSIT
jgi:hypothetical protein